jgi:predicted outer membrane repeat protein
LRIEPLEDRRMLANVTVSNLSDAVNGNTDSIALLIADNGGDGISLREAIYAANSTATADSISFSVNGTINLFNRPDPELDHLLIEDSLTINGPGFASLTIRAYNPTGAAGDGRRVFEINDGLAGLINVAINDVTITNGDLDASGAGAGIWNRGENLTVTDSVIANNRTLHVGGGIASNSAGNVTIINSTISGNSAGSNTLKSGGGVYASPSTGGVPGSLFIIATSINQNSAGNGGGIATSVPTTVSSVSMTGNTSNLRGGGIWATDDLTVTGSTISGNSAVTQGGGIYGQDTNFSYSTLSGNSTTGLISSGGGIWGGGTISSSTISGNATAGAGGGVAGGFDILNSTISGNSATTGGGVYRAYADSMLIRHSTISGNTAPAGSGSGIASPPSPSGNEVQLYSSIVAGNTNSDVDLVSGASGTVESLGYNLVGSGSAIGAFSAASGDKIGLNPMLHPLANNGGSTMTRAPMTGSPAIDGGNPSAVAGEDGVPPYDQRNVPHLRVRGARIDIGAFETTPVVPSLLGDYNRDTTVNAADYVFWRKFRNTTGWVAYAGPDGSGNGTIDPPDRSAWSENFAESAVTILGQAAPGIVAVRHAPSSLHGRVVPNGSATPSVARSVANMIWLDLPTQAKSQVDGEESGIHNAASTGDAEPDTGADALDAVFELFATGEARS